MSAVFSRISRYRDLPDVVVPDARGRAVESKSLRLLPEVEGALLHTVEEGDRLDLLAHRYFGQPRSWWHIADANPEFLSPRALLGHEPGTAVEIPVEWVGATPPWAGLLRALRGTPGVDAAAMGTLDRPEPVLELELAGAPSFALAPALSAELDASTVAGEVSPTLAAALEARGVALSANVRLEKHDGATWVLTDREDGRVHVFRGAGDAGPLNAYEAAPVHLWGVRAGFNRLRLAADDLRDVAASLGFEAGVPVEEQRVGRQIVIPPRPA